MLAPLEVMAKISLPGRDSALLITRNKWACHSLGCQSHSWFLFVLYICISVVSAADSARACVVYTPVSRTSCPAVLPQVCHVSDKKTTTTILLLPLLLPVPLLLLQRRRLLLLLRSPNWCAGMLLGGPVSGALLGAAALYASTREETRLNVSV